jgi:hypothetical protein
MIKFLFKRGFAAKKKVLPLVKSEKVTNKEELKYLNLLE